MVVDYEVEIEAVDQENATPVNATKVKAGLLLVKDDLLDLPNVDKDYMEIAFDAQISAGKCFFF